MKFSRQGDRTGQLAGRNTLGVVTMASAAALKAKELVSLHLPMFQHLVIDRHGPTQGNAAFKAQQYVEAIGHYTTAMVADRDDVTFPLNRAAAYLKLGKYVVDILLACAVSNDLQE